MGRQIRLHVENSRALITEEIPDCPLCRMRGEVIYKQTKDGIWPTPGEWSYRACTDCDALWLDPRPTLECFNIIYPEGYVIHYEAKNLLSRRAGFVDNIRLQIKLEVLRRAYGYNLDLHNAVAKFLGALAVLIPGVKHWAGFTVRFLPALGGRLLDVGCGNGEFLLAMSKLGWRAQGIEPDDISASLARKAGIDVYEGTIESAPLEPNSFDAITLHHVIEHLPDPMGTLRKLNNALKPGGWLVSVSPNPSGLLSRWFKGAWRGLEPPRHFVLPGPKSLSGMAKRVGLEATVWTTARNAGWMARESISIARHGDIRTYKGKYAPRLIAAVSKLLVMLNKDSGEEVILVGRKRQLNYMREPIPVYILHWNRPDDCARTVREFRNQDVPVKITVLDNGSEEESLKRLKLMIGESAGIVRLGKNLGFGPGLNEGLRKWLSGGTDDYAVVSAHDAIPRGDCLSRLLRIMEGNSRVGILSPEHDVGVVARFSGLKGPYLEKTSQPQVEGFEPQAFVNGVVMVFRRKCLQEIGIFDERYFAYGDEIDLCLRAQKYGWKVGPARGVRVENPGCSVPSAFASYLQVRNAILLVGEWKGRKWAFARALIFGLNAFRLLLWRSKRPAMFSSHAWLVAIIDGWLGITGTPEPGIQKYGTDGRGKGNVGDNAGDQKLEYKGLVQKVGVAGLHDAVAGMLASFLSPGARVLDCGGGSGAFALKLKDVGYYVEAIEVDKDFFNPKDISCYNTNLNDNFADLVKGKFDVVTAIEVIEHLENPRHFLRECHKLLNPRGKVLLTAPNVECVPARLKFLLKGSLRGFEFDLYSDPKRHEAEHITPIFSSLFMRVAKDTGFNVVDYVGYPGNGAFPNSRVVSNLISKLASAFLSGRKYGETHIFLMEKSGVNESPAEKGRST